MKRILLPLLLFCTAVFAFSIDFGVLVDQQFEMNNTTADYNPILIPWFSWNTDNGVSLYLSGLLSLQYNKFKDGSGSSLDLFPEFSRFSLSYRHAGFYAAAGRIAYTDAMGMIASGLFDGSKIEANIPVGTISAAALYTGFLYKKTAEINMTADDIAANSMPWNISDFGSYYASKRLLTSLRLDLPLAEYNTITFEALTQIDLNNREDSLNSQYTAVMAELYPQGKSGFIFGLLFEAMENRKGEFNAAFGAMFRYKTDVPGFLNDGFNVTMKFTSGSWGKTFTAFTPVTSHSQAKFLPLSISGLGMFSTDYTVLFHRTLKAEASFSYYMRTYKDPELKGVFYGGEVWGSIVWQPFSELRLLFEGGAFFPNMGNIFSGTDTLWKARAGLVLSF